MKVLVVAPHPDDEILGCGAQIKKHISKGHSVNVLVMTRGSSKCYSDEQIQIVRSEALKAHEYLGVEKTIFKNFNAPELDSYPISEIANEILSVIKMLGCELMYIPHRGDIHNDHYIIYKACLVAGRPVSSNSIKEIRVYETVSETEWAAPYGDDAFIPHLFSDVTEYFSAKLEAMSYFKSQLRDFPNPRSLQNLEALSKYRGSTVGVERAEAFMLVRRIE